jgi:hypothetical protein
MNTINKPVLILIGVALFGQAFAAEETGYRTINRTRLELILEAEGGEVISDNLKTLTAEEREDLYSSFSLIPLRNASYLASGFYLLDSSGGVKKFLYTEESKGYVHPSKDGNRYLVCKGAYSNFVFDDYSPVVKELYDIENWLIWAHEIKGHVKAADHLGTIIVKNVIRGPGIAIVNNGVYTRFFPKYGGNPFCISTDGGIIVIPEHDGRVPIKGPKGTRIYDNQGELLFTLNPDFVADIGTSTHKPLVIYASAKYIIQICQRAVRKAYDTPAFNDEGEELESLTGVPGEQYIQVYDRGGGLLWQEVFEVSPYITNFTVADNEEYIAVIIPNTTRECRVFELKTGKEKYRLSLPEDFGPVSDASISNDGSKLTVVEDKCEGPGDYTLDGKAILYIEGLEAAVFEHTYDYNETDGSFNVIFSEKGNLFVITANRGFRIFRISSDS